MEMDQYYTEDTDVGAAHEELCIEDRRKRIADRWIELMVDEYHASLCEEGVDR